MEYATNLIRAKAGKKHDSAAGEGADPDGFEDEEESWTFVGADAESQEDLSPEKVLMRTALGGTGPALGSRVLKSPGSGAGTVPVPGSRLG